jgi:hypothetical protein
MFIKAAVNRTMLCKASASHLRRECCDTCMRAHAAHACSDYIVVLCINHGQAYAKATEGLCEARTLSTIFFYHRNSVTHCEVSGNTYAITTLNKDPSISF